MDFKIIYEEDTELAEFEAECRGCRKDVIVIIGEKQYKIHIISMIRLQQDFETEIKDIGFYLAEPNTLIVQEVTKKEIEETVAKMYKCKYFERLDYFGFCPSLEKF